MPAGRTPITGVMTVREAFLNVLNEDLEELFSRVEALEMGGLSGVAVATEEEAILGENNSKMMTPLRTRQVLAYNPENYLSSGSSINMGSHKLISFQAETWDKIRLYGSSYGVAVNDNELTLYKASGAEVSIRNGGWNGTKAGDVIHTGNVWDKNVQKKVTECTSTGGDYLLYHRWLSNSLGAYLSTSYIDLVEYSIPWTGATRFVLYCINYDSYPQDLYVKIDTTEYGPFTINKNAWSYVTVDHNVVNNNAYVGAKASSTNNTMLCKYVRILTGNPECYCAAFLINWI